jgi:hypothetical protein
LLTTFRGGIANLPDILEQIADTGGWTPFNFESRMEDSNSKSEAPREKNQEEYEIIWQSSIGALAGPATSMLEAMIDGLEHLGLQLEIIPRPGTKTYFNWVPGAKKTGKADVEAEGKKIKPGDPGFSTVLEEVMNEFSKRRVESLTAWSESKGLSAIQLKKLQTLGEHDMGKDPADAHVIRDHQQLYLILYTQHMVSKKPTKRFIDPANSSS